MTQTQTTTAPQRDNADELEACVEQLIENEFCLSDFSADVRHAAEHIYPIVVELARKMTDRDASEESLARLIECAVVWLDNRSVAAAAPEIDNTPSNCAGPVQYDPYVRGL